MNNMEEKLNTILQPSDELVNEIASLEGDILVLGVGGKIGPSLAMLAAQATRKSGVKRRIIGVSRFNESGLEDRLQSEGIETYRADILNENELQSMPDAANVLYLAGMKFGTTGNEPLTWAMNTYVPGRVAEKYRNSRIIVYSTGNVYPFSPVLAGGSDEQTAAAPVGEYGQSCLGRERIFEYFAKKYQTALLIYRLNYANDLRYGVLVEIAKSVMDQKPIDLRMGHVNVIWQGDANEIALRSFRYCSTPAKLLNVTGPETVSVKWMAEQFGEIFRKTPVFIHEERATALLSNAAESFRLFGYPKISLKEMIQLTSEWLIQDGNTINKPTHFQEMEGRF